MSSLSLDKNIFWYRLKSIFSPLVFVPELVLNSLQAQSFSVAQYSSILHGWYLYNLPENIHHSDLEPELTDLHSKHHSVCTPFLFPSTEMRAMMEEGMARAKEGGKTFFFFVPLWRTFFQFFFPLQAICFLPATWPPVPAWVLLLLGSVLSWGVCH